MNTCPICGKEVESYHELTQTEPYIHNISYDGLMIYGAFTAPKETLCFDGKFLHFAFWDAENNLVDHRLVQLGVENPATKSPTDEYMEGIDDDYESDLDEWDDDPWDDEDGWEDDYNGYCEDNNPNDSRNL